MKLERVSEAFRVIALGVPVPKFRGFTLDPPFRSRFQCLNIGALSFVSAKQLCAMLAPRVDSDNLDKLICLSFGVNSHKEALTLPPVPLDNLRRVAQIWVRATAYLFVGNHDLAFLMLFNSAITEQ